MAATLAKVPTRVLKSAIIASFRRNSFARNYNKIALPFFCSIFRGETATARFSAEHVARWTDQGFSKMTTRQQSNYAVPANAALEEPKHEKGEETLPLNDDMVSVVPRADINGKCVIANANIKAGTHLFTLYGDKHAQRTLYTIQVGPDTHVHPEGKLIFVNHSCSPNTKFQYLSSWDLHAVRDIAIGEELTFDYTTTEWQMAQPFECGCGSTKCVHKVQGFYFLTPEQRVDREQLISPIIREQFQEEKEKEE